MKLALAVGLFILLAGCSGYVYVIPPASHVTVSQGLQVLQQAADAATKHKPVVRNITLRQAVPGLSQKASGLIRPKPSNITAKQNLSGLGQNTISTARQPGSFSDEYSPEYQ